LRIVRGQYGKILPRQQPIKTNACHIINKLIPYRSETFGGEDCKINQTIQYYIFSIFVVSSTFFSTVTEPEITLKNWPENIQPK
jgi:hypothetical protein